MTPALLTRGEAEARIIGAIEGKSPPRFVVVDAPRGMGKTTLLQRIGSSLSDSGTTHAVVDGARLGAGPVELARTFPAAVDRALRQGGSEEEAGPRASHLKQTLEQELAKTRSDQAHLLDLTFSYPGSVAADLGSPFVLLLDDAGEAIRHAKHPGLKDSFEIIARSLHDDSQLMVIMALSPDSRAGAFVETLQAEAGGSGAVHIHLAPMTLDEMPQGGLTGEQSDLLMLVTAGRPLWVDHLAREMEQGDGLESALVEGLTPPRGFLYQECRFDYHMLIERCRGDAVVRTIMMLLAREHRAGLTRIARYLGTSLPTALDYLSWMLEVAMIRRDGRAYSISDPVMRAWVAVNGPAAETLQEAVTSLVQGSGTGRPASPREEGPIPSRQPSPPVSPEPLKSPDLLMEID